jgi:hypothetical protein
VSAKVATNPNRSLDWLGQQPRPFEGARRLNGNLASKDHLGKHALARGTADEMAEFIHIRVSLRCPGNPERRFRQEMAFERSQNTHAD